MRTKKTSVRIWVAIAIAQLCFVTAGASGMPFASVPIIGRALNYYADMSGASHSYGFFSPGVYAQLRAVISVWDNDGNKTVHPLTDGTSREVELRMNDIFENFMNDFEDQVAFQRNMAASLAGSVFAQDPHSRKVEVKIERLFAPSREDYLKGERPGWDEVYSARFIHKAGLEARSEKK